MEHFLNRLRQHKKNLLVKKQIEEIIPKKIERNINKI